MVKISVIINTFNRPKKAFNTVKSILKSDFEYNDFEIIVVEQEGKEKLLEKVANLQEDKISYFNLTRRGASRAKNFGIKRAKGKIIAFTDDDCLVSKNWLREIYRNFRNNKKILALFGRTLPYQPKKHKGLICPCTFERKNERFIAAPAKHWQVIGFGNNMAFRKDSFRIINGFKEWLGPASLGLAAEDAEICLRILSEGHKILYDPRAVVFHNRWLKKGSDKWKKNIWFYRCGKLAAYGFYAFQGIKIGKEVIREHLKSTFWENYPKLKMGLRHLSLKILRDIFFDIYYNLRGLMVAFWFAKIDKTLKKAIFSLNPLSSLPTSTLL